MVNRPVSYFQTDPRWSKLPYAVAGEKATIGGSGCGPTAAAMVIATLVDPAVTPAALCNWSLAHGYKCCGRGTYYSYFGPQGAACGLSWEQLNWSSLRNLSFAKAAPYHDKALSAIMAGDMVICCMGPATWTTGGHFILWYAIEGDSVLINDPASTAAHRHRNQLVRLRAEVKYYFICHAPRKREDIDMTEEQLNRFIDTRVATKLEAAKEAQWYATLADVPEVYRPAIERLMTMPRQDDPTKMVLVGDNGGKDGDPTTIAEKTIRVDETFCRVATILYRAGTLG